MSYYFPLFLLLFSYINLWFIVFLIKKRNDLADIAWGLGFVILAWAAFFLAQNFSHKGLLVNILVTVWGLRLALHIYWRNKDKKEDFRYQMLSKNWGKWFYLRSYLQVYFLQGCLLFLIALPIITVQKNSFGSFFSFWDFLGLGIWVIGFAFEVISDFQLQKFLENPANKGKLLQKGLWAYSRHPNYFGEVTLWWGIWMLCGFEDWFTIIGPLTITVLILKVSGIPLLEKKMSVYPGFAEYKRRVSIFFPLPQKNT